MLTGTHVSIDDTRNNDVLIYINGDLFHRNEAKISVFDSGYLIGDGIWEAVRLYNGALVFIDQHLDRLFSAAKSIGLDLKLSKVELISEIYKMLKANSMETDVHVRIMFTRGTKKTPSQDPRYTISGPNLVIIAEYKKASEEVKRNGIKLFTSTIRRGSPDYLDPRLNCHSKLHEVQALIQALEAGADEALMLDQHGFVATCNSTNFFVVRNGAVWTSTGKYCMNGITRANVIAICKMNQIEVHEKDFSLFDVYSADESFTTGTFGGLTPVIKIDGRMIGEGMPGPITEKLNMLYKNLIEEEVTSSKKNNHVN